jgi:hypothetical protein
MGHPAPGAVSEDREALRTAGQEAGATDLVACEKCRLANAREKAIPDRGMAFFNDWASRPEFERGAARPT